MATRKKAAKKAAKKRAKKGATKAPRRRRAKGADHHLTKAHVHVMRCIDTVTVADRPAIERVRRALDHAHDNTRVKS